MPNPVNGISNIHQFLGPVVIGSVKETNPSYATTPGYMRNLGASDAYQSGTLAYTTTTSTSNLTYTQTNTASPTSVVVIPAGAYIDSINIDVTTAFNAGTNNTITLALTATSGTAGTTIATVTASGATIGTGRYTLGITVGSAAFALSNIANWVNVSTGQTTPSDQIAQAYFTGTGTAATTGACTITIDYVVRNPDGSWYQQTPAYPITNPPVMTY